MAKEETADSIVLKLRTLWKGTLYIAILALYATLLVMLFLNSGWRAALLGFALLMLAQMFRRISSDVDRLAWVMDSNEVKGEQTRARKYQSRMFWLLYSLVQVCNIAIVYQVYKLFGSRWASYVVAGLILVELIFRVIRSVDRTTDYEVASYGIADSGPLSTGPEHQAALRKPQKTVDPQPIPVPEPKRKLPVQAASIGKRETSERKLAILKQMAERGEISQTAYEHMRDRERITQVMNNPLPDEE